MQDASRCIEEVMRVLRPGGRFGILELTRPSHWFLRLGHTLYLKTALPVIGKVLLANKQAYSYLCNSIQNFSSPTELESVMQEKGFQQTWRQPLMGGVATIIGGQKGAHIPQKKQDAWEEPRLATASRRLSRLVTPRNTPLCMGHRASSPRRMAIPR